MEKPDKRTVAQALATAFGVPLQPGTTRLDDMDYTRVQVFEHDDDLRLIDVIGVEGAWTFHVEFAGDGTGDIEAYGAGDLLRPHVIEPLTKANIALHGFLVGGMRMFSLNPDYDQESRTLIGKLAERVEKLQGRPQRTQA